MGLAIKNLPVHERPREKLEKYGPEKLKDAELLALLLGSGTKGMNVLQLSSNILAKWKGKGLGTATIAELVEVHGLGKAKACEIVACFELGRRLLKDKQVSILLTPKDVWDRMADVRESKREHFVVFFLDSRNQETHREIVSIGTLNESIVHPREVFEQAIKHSASAVLVAHNHPSGDPLPSDTDIRVTKRLHDAAKLLGISLADHVIVTKDSWRSILEESVG